VIVPGWVRLPVNVHPEDLETLTLQPVKQNVLEYRCPVCGNRERSDIAGLEPCCTGPGVTDDHPMEVMVLLDPSNAASRVAF
jgi:hypothetical protein